MNFVFEHLFTNLNIGNRGGKGGKRGKRFRKSQKSQKAGVILGQPPPPCERYPPTSIAVGRLLRIPIREKEFIEIF